MRWRRSRWRRCAPYAERRGRSALPGEARPVRPCRLPARSRGSRSRGSCRSGSRWRRRAPPARAAAGSFPARPPPPSLPPPVSRQRSACEGAPQGPRRPGRAAVSAPPIPPSRPPGELLETGLAPLRVVHGRVPSRFREMVEEGFCVFVWRFEVRGVAGVSEQAQASVGDRPGHALRDRAELRVALARDEQGLRAQRRQLFPQRRLRSRTQMAERRGQAEGAVAKAALVQRRRQRLGKVAQRRERRMLLPASYECLDALALCEGGERLVLELAAGPLVVAGDSGRPALENERPDAIGEAQRVRERQPRSHRVACEVERRRSERFRERVERVVPSRGVGARSMPGEIRSDDVEARVEALAQVIERPPGTGEPVQEGQDHGPVSRAEATAASSARWRSTLRARSERTWMSCSPSVSRSAARSSGRVLGECRRAPANLAACARSSPCGVPNSSSKRDVWEAMGRKEKIPPPSLSTTTTVSGAFRRAAATRPPRSCRSARSPRRTAVRPLLVRDAPRADETTPSIPFTPRFARTRTSAPRPAQASTSRTGMLFETKTCDPAGRAASNSRATAGSEGSGSRAKSPSSAARARRSASPNGSAAPSGRSTQSASAKPARTASPTRTRFARCDGSKRTPSSLTRTVNAELPSSHCARVFGVRPPPNRMTASGRSASALLRCFRMAS